MLGSIYSSWLDSHLSSTWCPIFLQIFWTILVSQASLKVRKKPQIQLLTFPFQCHHMDFMTVEWHTKIMMFSTVNGTVFKTYQLIILICKVWHRRLIFGFEVLSGHIHLGCEICHCSHWLINTTAAAIAAITTSTTEHTHTHTFLFFLSSYIWK